MKKTFPISNPFRSTFGIPLILIPLLVIAGNSHDASSSGFDVSDFIGARNFIQSNVNSHHNSWRNGDTLHLANRDGKTYTYRFQVGSGFNGPVLIYSTPSKSEKESEREAP